MLLYSVVLSLHSACEIISLLFLDSSETDVWNLCIFAQNFVFRNLNSLAFRTDEKIYHLGTCSNLPAYPQRTETGKDVVLQDIKTEKLPGGSTGWNDPNGRISGSFVQQSSVETVGQSWIEYKKLSEKDYRKYILRRIYLLKRPVKRLLEIKFYRQFEK